MSANISSIDIIYINNYHALIAIIERKRGMHNER